MLNKLFQKKGHPIKNYEDFWNWFSTHSRTFFKVVKKHDNIVEDFFDKISPKLGELKDGYYYLTGMLDDNTAELVLTPDGTVKNIVFVEELVAKAPAIPGWKFTALKPQLNIENVNIEMDGHEFSKSTLSFYSNDDPNYPDEIDITIIYSKYIEDDRDTIVRGVFIFLDNFLGELNSVTAIDNVNVLGPADGEKELVPIEKLNDFLVWREKEFIEKYHGVVKDISNMEHSILEATLDDGHPLIAAVNTEILNWENKASHPWILSIEISYDGSQNRGLPSEETNKKLWELEERLSKQLATEEGYLLIGHESVKGTRNIYFACKDFRKPSKIAHQLQVEDPQMPFTYDLYKDKYWKSFNRFQPH